MATEAAYWRDRYDDLREAALPIAERCRCCPDCDGSGDDPDLDRLLRLLGLIAPAVTAPTSTTPAAS
jgi:hypothetical protein